MSHLWYTYVLIDPRTGLPFYVGKGRGRRMYQHERSHSRRVREWVAEIRAAGLKVVYEKWFEHEDEDFCYWMEQYLIDYFGRENVCNLTRGGEGPPSGENHPSKDPKFKAKSSAVHKVFYQTPEGLKARQAISERQKGKPSPHKGKKWHGRVNATTFKSGHKNSEKARRQTSQRMLGNKYTAGNTFRRGAKATPETIQRLRESHLGQEAWNKGQKNPGWTNSGSFKKGTPNLNRKLTENDIPLICDLLVQKVPVKEIAKQFGVSFQLIYAIKYGRRYVRV